MGKVKLKVSNNRLQIVFSHHGERYYLSLGLADTKRNREIAMLKASRIEEDILFERFTGIEAYRKDAENPCVSTKG